MSETKFKVGDKVWYKGEWAATIIEAGTMKERIEEVRQLVADNEEDKEILEGEIKKYTNKDVYEIELEHYASVHNSQKVHLLKDYFIMRPKRGATEFDLEK